MLLKIRPWLLSLLIIGGLFLAGCTPAQVNSASSSSPSATSSSSLESTSPTATPASSSKASKLPVLNGKATVVITVKDEPITIEVDGNNAPITAGNFVDLVQRKVYDGTMFHRVVQTPQPFVVQGGDPQSKDPNFPQNLLGTGGFIDPKTGEERYIPLEIKVKGATTPTYSKIIDNTGGSSGPVLKHKLGAVAMARSQEPDSASSQFYIALGNLDSLDGSYAVFGYVTKGMDIVDKIQQGDRIQKAVVTQGVENLKTNGQ